MKIRYMSDLHLEFTDYEPAIVPSTGEDVVVLAGDIGVGTEGVKWAMSAFEDRPVLYLTGNHEFYNQHWMTLLDRCRAVARGSNVHFMENDAVVLGGIRFLGCALWTDFRGMGPGTQSLAMDEAGHRLTDYRAIITGPDGKWRNLVPADTIARHTESKVWLEREIAGSSEPVVVVTHHGPSMAACGPQYKGDLLTAAFLNDLDQMFKPPVRAWIHGHTHFAIKTEVNGIPLLTNPRGYPKEPVRFDWDAMIEVVA